MAAQARKKNLVRHSGFNANSPSSCTRESSLPGCPKERSAGSLGGLPPVHWRKEDPVDPDKTAAVTRRSFMGGLGVSAAAQTLSAAPAGKEVKIGIVGGGFGSSFQWHLHPKCKVTAVCDIRPDRLQRLSEVYR